MAIKGRHTRLLVDAFDFSGQSNSLEVSLSNERIDVTPFQADGKQFIAGDMTGTLASNGYFNDGTAGNLEAELYALLAASTPATVCALFGTNSTPCPGYLALGSDISNITIASPIDGVVTVAGEWTGGTSLTRGLLVWRGTLTGNQTQATPAYIDLGAAGVAGGVAVAFVQGLAVSSETNSLILEAAAATNFASPTTLATFVPEGVGAITKTLAGSVPRYLRVRSTSPVATVFTFCLVAAVRGVTY